MTHKMTQSMLETVTEYRINAPAGRYEVEFLFADLSGKGDNSPYLLGRYSGQTTESTGSVMEVRLNGKSFLCGLAVRKL